MKVPMFAQNEEERRMQQKLILDVLCKTSIEELRMIVSSLNEEQARVIIKKWNEVHRLDFLNEPIDPILDGRYR